MAKGGTGFPTLFFFEPESGAVLSDSLWPEDEESVREALREAQAKAAGLQKKIGDAKAKPEDKRLQAELALELALMRAGTASLAELKELAQTPGIDPALLERFRAWFNGRRVEQAFSEAREKAESREQFEGLVEAACYELMKEGVRLPAENEYAQSYYDAALNGAVTKGDKAVGEAAYGAYEKLLLAIKEANPNMAERVDDALEEARGRVQKIGEAKER